MRNFLAGFSLVLKTAVLVVAVWVVLVVPLSAQTGSTPVDFLRDIRPILSDYCFACHGPDSATRKGGFRFDVRESAFGAADSGDHPLVAGDISASEVVRRIRSDDEYERMPPADSGKLLSPQQMEQLESWIAAGAPWQEHWAFVPPVRPNMPTVKNDQWPLNPVDYFVLAQMEARGMAPSPAADKPTLVRRLYLDLLGLPPTPEQVDLFLNDPAPDAFERLVDRLLESPHYGEHMATFWLDAARFADTNGYQNDFRRSMWLWRNWLIQACNNNMPYDQFVIEQLAGDMIPDATLEQKIATGFNRNHRMNTEGGSINEEWLVENVVDRVETTSTVFLGLTMGCARCHDHKFDPVTQKEFYQFFAYFNNIDEKGVYEETRGNVPPLVEVATPEHVKRMLVAQDNVNLAEQQVQALALELDDQRKAWEAGLLDREIEVNQNHQASLPGPSPAIRPPSLVAIIENFRATRQIVDAAPGPAMVIESREDGHLDIGDARDFDAAKSWSVGVWIWPDENGAILSRMDEHDAYRGFDMLIMPDGRMHVHLIHNWPNNATKITTVPAIPNSQWTHVTVANHAPGRAEDLQVWFNGQPVTHTVDADTLNGTTLTTHPVWLGYRGQTPRFAGKIADLRIWDQPLDTEAVSAVYHAALQRMVARTRQQTSDELESTIRHHRSAGDPRYAKAQESLSSARRELAEQSGQVPTTMVMAERASRGETHVLSRGQYDQPDLAQPVSPGVPGLFNSSSVPANRLELANWMVDGSNPLTARVAVNHFWRRCFGTGLLETAENFGVQSPLPSHPQLLDWLATELVNTGWDVKQMQRLMVTSATWRQRSHAIPLQYQADPENRWLARGARFRLSAESIRDNALVISGLLTPRIGGPSIMPYQPQGLWEELAGGAREPPYTIETGDDLYRRSLYIYRKRTVPHPVMTTFDGTSREVCVVARSRTNTPLQALALLNDPTYVEAARHLAVKALDFSPDSAAQIRYAFRCATARWPDDRELELLTGAWERYQESFRDSPEAAVHWTTAGQSPADSVHEPRELAAMTSVASVILNLDEVITRQ